MIEVILIKKYQNEILKHIILLNQTTCSFQNIQGEQTSGRIIGVSMIDDGTQLLIVDNKAGIYNRNISEVRINGKFEKIKEA